MPRKPEPEIKPCPAGHAGANVETWRLDQEYGLQCHRGHCWAGPIRKTRRGAIKAWNKRVSDEHE